MLASAPVKMNSADVLQLQLAATQRVSGTEIRAERAENGVNGRSRSGNGTDCGVYRNCSER